MNEKLTYNQTLSFVNSHERSNKWKTLTQEEQQKASDYLLSQTGWNLSEFCKEELKHHLMVE